MKPPPSIRRRAAPAVPDSERQRAIEHEAAQQCAYWHFRLRALRAQLADINAQIRRARGAATKGHP